MNKQIHAFDAEHKATDAAAIKGTDIILKETGTGKVAFLVIGNVRNFQSQQESVAVRAYSVD